MKLLTREEAEPLIKSGRLRPAYLYESGDKVLVELSFGYRKIYVYVDDEPDADDYADRAEWKARR